MRQSSPIDTSVADGDVGMDDRAGADADATADGDERSDRHALAEHGIVGHRGERDAPRGGAFGGCSNASARAKV